MLYYRRYWIFIPASRTPFPLSLRPSFRSIEFHFIELHFILNAFAPSFIIPIDLPGCPRHGPPSFGHQGNLRSQSHKVEGNCQANGCDGIPNSCGRPRNSQEHSSPNHGFGRNRQAVGRWNRNRIHYRSRKSSPHSPKQNWGCYASRCHRDPLPRITVLPSVVLPCPALIPCFVLCCVMLCLESVW